MRINELFEDLESVVNTASHVIPLVSLAISVLGFLGLNYLKHKSVRNLGVPLARYMVAKTRTKLRIHIVSTMTEALESAKDQLQRGTAADFEQYLVKLSNVIANNYSERRVWKNMTPDQVRA